MLFLNFARIFQLKGIHKPFAYLTSNGYSPGYATKLANNRISEISISYMYKFCKEFNCTPNDIFEFRVSPSENLPPDHALHTLTKREAVKEITAKINALPIEKIMQMHDIIKNME